MGIIKDAIREVLQEAANKQGLDIQFLDTPPKVIETREQAKKHDMELVEKKPVEQPKEYSEIVYKYNGWLSSICKRQVLFLFIIDIEKDETVAYISFSRDNNLIYLTEGCSFGEYNVYHKNNPHQRACAANAKNLQRDTEYLEKVYDDEKYKFVITKIGKEYAKAIFEQE